MVEAVGSEDQEGLLRAAEPGSAHPRSSVALITSVSTMLCR